MNFSRILTILAALTLLVACDDKNEDANAEPTEAVETTAEPAAKPEPKPADQEEAVDAEALAALDAMDGRKPVPLMPMMAHHQKQNMREHLVAVQEVVHATAKQDFAAVEKAAGAIGSSPQMTQMCNHMGAGAPGFTEQALAFHRKADGIIEAAKAEDANGVLTALDETLAACTSCHETYKQQVVSQSAWTDVTGQHAPDPAHH